MGLIELGFDGWFEEKAGDLCKSGQSIARVVTVDRGRYVVKNEQWEIAAELTGRFLYSSDSALDLPCVGDWVCVQIFDTDNLAIIHEILSRKTSLRRKSAGKDIDYQMIAANIDVAFIVQSCHYDFNVRRLERYLVMVNEGKIEPIILLTKIDLVDPDELDRLIEWIRSAGITARIIALSNMTGAGLDQIREVMIAGRTHCLLGSSGVGKTTLINQLLGYNLLKTHTVSDTGEGRHATARRQLIILDQGAMLIDTPGMRELGILDAAEGIDAIFSDIQELSQRCRYTNCRHEDEPGCAIRVALADGTLNRDHYQNYSKLIKESNFHNLSYTEKRKKDRAFGRYKHSVMKHKDKKK